MQRRKKYRSRKKEHSFSLFWLVKKRVLKGWYFIQTPCSHVMKSVCFKIHFRICTALLQSKKTLIRCESNWNEKMVNGSPSDSYQIMLLFRLGEKYYPKEMRLIRKRKAKEIQEKKGKQKKKKSR